ncbi:MAG: HypC/HybG/HupF family hydrogenase formation chaperone [Chloroflexi bacterium]|nr:HypC/HybG/HupF family hydrogenase formation chaperone [Chloroflexota bacterium]
MRASGGEGFLIGQKEIAEVCLALPGRVTEVDEGEADVELIGGRRVRASRLLCPDLAVGHYVLLDRGMVLDMIDRTAAEELAALHAALARALETVESAESLEPVEEGRASGG